MAKRFLLYHWSPSKNRERIEHNGLVPGSVSKDGSWKPPYICFSDSPVVAWWLMRVTAEPDTLFDLWVCWSDCVSGREKMGHAPEWRIYERIPKRHLWYAGTRQFHPAQKAPSQWCPWGHRQEE